MLKTVYGAERRLAEKAIDSVTLLHTHYQRTSTHYLRTAAHAYLLTAVHTYLLTAAHTLPTHCCTHTTNALLHTYLRTAAHTHLRTAAALAPYPCHPAHLISSCAPHIPCSRVFAPQALKKGRMETPPRYAGYEEAVNMFLDGEQEMDAVLDTVASHLWYRCDCGTRFATFSAYQRHQQGMLHFAY